MSVKLGGKEIIMSISQASVFICKNDDPKSDRGYKAM